MPSLYLAAGIVLVLALPLLMVVLRAGSAGAWKQRLLLSGVVLVALGHGFLFYGSSGGDDAYFTYWPAETLAATGAIQNLNMEAVEQSSSLLHVAVLALLLKLTGAFLPTLGGFFSIACGVAALVATWFLARRIVPDAPVLAPLLLALSPYFIYWAFGGLETALVSCLFALVALSTSDYLFAGGRLALVGTGLWTGLYVVVRPESIFVLVTALTLVGAHGLWTRRRRVVRRLAPLLALGALFFLAVSAWRWVNYSQLFPQPVYAKAKGLALPVFVDGLRYMVDSLVGAPVLAALMLVAVWEIVRRASAEAPGAYGLRRVCGAFVAAHLAFVVFSGGDWMEAGRFVVPIIPLVVTFAAHEVMRLARWRAAILALLCAALIGETVALAKREHWGTPLQDVGKMIERSMEELEIPRDRFSWFEFANWGHRNDMPIVLALENMTAHLLAEQEPPVIIASGQMGMVPYYLARRFGEQVRFVDLRGIATRHMTDCPITARVGRTRLGVAMNYPMLLGGKERLLQRCGFPIPMIVFDLELLPEEVEPVTRAGYSVVYRQPWEFIAVRRDLVPSIGEIPPSREDWPPNP